MLCLVDSVIFLSDLAPPRFQNRGKSFHLRKVRPTAPPIDFVHDHHLFLVVLTTLHKPGSDSLFVVLGVLVGQECFKKRVHYGEIVVDPERLGSAVMEYFARGSLGRVEVRYDFPVVLRGKWDFGPVRAPLPLKSSESRHFHRLEPGEQKHAGVQSRAIVPNNTVFGHNIGDAMPANVRHFHVNLPRLSGKSRYESLYGRQTLGVLDHFLKNDLSLLRHSRVCEVRRHDRRFQSSAGRPMHAFGLHEGDATFLCPNLQAAILVGLDVLAPDGLFVYARNASHVGAVVHDLRHVPLHAVRAGNLRGATSRDESLRLHCFLLPERFLVLVFVHLVRKRHGTLSVIPHDAEPAQGGVALLVEHVPVFLEKAEDVAALVRFSRGGVPHKLKTHCRRVGGRRQFVGFRLLKGGAKRSVHQVAVLVLIVHRANVVEMFV